MRGRKASNETRAMGLVGQALALLGLATNDLPDDELDLKNTPRRVVRMWLELTKGVRSRAPKVSAFKSDHRQLLMLRDIPFVSLCSHHMVPFRGKAHVGYIPNGKIVGISKPARVVDYYAAMPQTQERLTQQVVDHLMASLVPMGVMVVLVAEHNCFTGCTSISLVNGSEVPIKDLVGRDPFWVYSVDPTTMKIVPGKATAYKTRENAELVEVTLDNGQSVRCTPDHRFMLRDGSYREAKDLTPGTSLMPLYRKIGAKARERIVTNGHPNSGRVYTSSAIANMCQGQRRRWSRPDEKQRMMGNKFGLGNRNHKVVSVRPLSEREDVYCLEVQDYHNFALSAGVFVHNCVSCRGAKKPGSSFVTSAIGGVFLKDPSAKEEFLSLLGLKP